MLVATKRSQLVALVALVAALSAAPGISAAAAQDEFPTTAGEARRYYESRIDNWTSGPAEALLTNEEREIWGSLEDTAQKERFIRWFWDRRDPDGRALGNRFQEEFYERVAESNQRYRGFPRGWKSDRGRVRIVLGDPDTISRQTYAQLGGIGPGPDFEIWSYSNLGSNRAFQASGGEFLVYFAETRVAQFEVYDFRWGAGVWDRNTRMAFELTVEDAIIDPLTQFEAGEASGEYVREISEGTLPAEIPTGIWGELGAGGMVSVPVQIRLGDLLFQPDDGTYVARLEATLQVGAPGSSGATSVRAPWEIRLAEEELLALGNGSFVTALSAPAPEGAHDVSLVVTHPLAVTDAEWSESVTVSAAPGTAIVVGNTVLTLGSDDPGAIGILMPAAGSFATGDTIVVGAWMRGPHADPRRVSMQLEAGSGSYTVEVDETSWLEGPAGPLLVRARVPELEAGEYTLRVDFGDGTESASVTIEIG